MDDTDWKLLTLLNENPGMSQSELSKELGITQPAICLRLKKLEEKEILKHISGLNPKRTNFSFVLYEGKGDLLKVSKHAHFVCGFSNQGKINAVFYGSCSDEATKVVKDFFKDGKITVLNDVAGDFVIPVRSHKECCPKK